MERKLSDLTEITLKMLIDESIINPDVVLYSDTKPVRTAKLNSDGFIELNIDGNQ
jgi:hypothetical protein